jgi:hypothetical protein
MDNSGLLIGTYLRIRRKNGILILINMRAENQFINPCYGLTWLYTQEENALMSQALFFPHPHAIS